MFMIPKFAKVVSSASKRFGTIPTFAKPARCVSQITVSLGRSGDG